MSCGSRHLRALPYANRQHDHLNAEELQPALNRKRRVTVQRTREDRLALEHQLPGEDDGALEFPRDVGADVLELVDQVGSERVARLRIEAETVGEPDVTLEIAAHFILERAHLVDALELGGVDEA